LQDQITPNETFLARTDALAFRKGISLRALAEVLGISHAALFGYRSGRQPVSQKAWSKLDQCERETNRVYSTILNENAPSTIRHAETPYRVNLKSPPAFESAAKMSETERLLDRIANALEKLVELEERRTPKP
jgi:predicted transcriptional regulator